MVLLVATENLEARLAVYVLTPPVVIEEGLGVKKFDTQVFLYLLSPLLGLPAICCLQVGYTAGGGAGLHTREDSLQLLQLFCLALPQYTSPKGSPLSDKGGYWGYKRGTG